MASTLGASGRLAWVWRWVRSCSEQAPAAPL